MSIVYDFPAIKAKLRGDDWRESFRREVGAAHKAMQSWDGIVRVLGAAQAEDMKAPEASGDPPPKPFPGW